MIYEYECSAGHVTEHHVKLDGTGTPTSCTFRDEGECTNEPEAYASFLCKKPIKRILSLGSAYFPGAGSWRGA